MSQPTAVPTPVPAAAPPAPPSIHVTESGRASLKLYEKEIAAYLRELPRLLEERFAGDYVLIKGEELLAVFDTQNDAIIAGRLLFDLDPIFVKVIDARDSERYSWLFAQLQAEKPCQS